MGWCEISEFHRSFWHPVSATPREWKGLWKTGSHLSCTVIENAAAHYVCLTDSSQQQLLVICQEPGVWRRSHRSRGHMQQCSREAVFPPLEHAMLYSTGRRIQCNWAKNSMNLRVCFLDPKPTSFSFWGDAQSHHHAIMHHHESVGHDHAQGLPLPHPRQPLPPTEHHPSSATPSKNPLVSSPRAQDNLLSHLLSMKVDQHSGICEWLWTCLYLLLKYLPKLESTVPTLLVLSPGNLTD